MHSRKIESSSSTSSQSGSTTSSLYETLAYNSNNLKGPRGPKRLSTRIEEVLDESDPKITKLPPINLKSAETRMEAARNRVTKKLEAVRDFYE